VGLFCYLEGMSKKLGATLWQRFYRHKCSESLSAVVTAITFGGQTGFKVLMLTRSSGLGRTLYMDSHQFEAFKSNFEMKA